MVMERVMEAPQSSAKRAKIIAAEREKRVFPIPGLSGYESAVYGQHIGS